MTALPDLFGHVEPVVTRTAVLGGANEEFRYLLGRDMGRPGRRAFFGMVNPSRADAKLDDQTILKLYGFSERNGIGSFVVANKFAFRSKDVTDLRDAADPIGPDNDAWLERAMRDADIHVVAWGPLAKLPPRLRNRWRDVVAIADRVGCRLHCLGVAMDGHPLHPVMLGYAREIVPWTPPRG